MNLLRSRISLDAIGIGVPHKLLAAEFRTEPTRCSFVLHPDAVFFADGHSTNGVNVPSHLYAPKADGGGSRPLDAHIARLNASHSPLSDVASSLSSTRWLDRQSVRNRLEAATNAPNVRMSCAT